MPTVISVKFTYATRELWFDPTDSGAQEGDHVICATERGIEIGLACSDPRVLSYEELRATTRDAALKPVLRVATDDDLSWAEELAAKGEQALPVFRRLVSESQLQMKPIAVEYLFGGGKAVCYFSAEDRVDFRQLVRSLAKELHERIDMRQIGVREEAAVIGGYAHCGQELCCARFGRQFEPVSIRMAKEQDLPLNSSKISGACGRLMCCLRYEFEAYRDFKGRAPKRNALIETPLGMAKIVEYDTPKEQICLRLESGKQIRVPLAEMQVSESAHKKSKELGCPCRPDSVTRAALERLESPEVKMALAELDRQAGLIADEGFDAEDIFVDSQPRRRRRRTGAAEDAPATASRFPQQSSNKKQAADEGRQGTAAARRRRKKRPAAAPAPASAPAAAGVQDEHTSEQPKRRRRRHHAAAASEQSQSQRRTQQEGQPQHKKRRRRPGDKGGFDEAQPKHAAAAKHAAAQQPTDDAVEQKKRRRRRYRGRGRGKPGQGGQGQGAE